MTVRRGHRGQYPKVVGQGLTRKLDERRRNTPLVRYVREAIETIGRHGLVDYGLGIVTQSNLFVYQETGIGLRTYDSSHGVLVASAFSDLPRHRAQVERILGKGAHPIYTNQHGTIYAPKGVTR